MDYVNQKVENDFYVRETLVPYKGSDEDLPDTWPSVFELADEKNHPIKGHLSSIVKPGVPALYDFACAACSAPGKRGSSTRPTP